MRSTSDSLTEREEVTIVVNIYGDAEFILQERAESHAVAERGEIGEQTADNAVGIVGRAGESKAYCHRLLIELGNYLLKTFDHGLKAKVKVLRIGGQCDGIDDELVGLHSTENQVCATGIKCDNYTLVKFVHGRRL